MTVCDIIRQAQALLGQTDTRADGEVPGGTALYKRAVPLVNQIAAELWYRDNTAPFTPLGLQADIPLSDALVQTVMPYGVAMLLAQVDGDVDNQTLFAELYDARRIPGGAARITDVLPVGN